MSDKKHIESLIKEAELYRRQSLLNQAREKYDEILEFINGHEHYKKNEKLITAIKGRIKVMLIEIYYMRYEQYKKSCKRTVMFLAN